MLLLGMDYVHLSNEQLLALLKRDDPKAFQTIYQLYWKDCYRIARNKLQSKILAEEVTQNVFVSLWERRGQLEIKNLRAYLFTSIKYQVINFIEAKLITEKHLPSLPKAELYENSIEYQVYKEELMLTLEKALQQLPPKTEQIFRMSRFEYLSGKEIAQQMKLSEKSVEYHISKALRFLRLELKDYMGVVLIFLLS